METALLPSFLFLTFSRRLSRPSAPSAEPGSLGSPGLGSVTQVSPSHRGDVSDVASPAALPPLPPKCLPGLRSPPPGRGSRLSENRLGLLSYARFLPVAFRQRPSTLPLTEHLSRGHLSAFLAPRRGGSRPTCIPSLTPPGFHPSLAGTCS